MRIKKEIKEKEKKMEYFRFNDVKKNRTNSILYIEQLKI